MKAISNCLFFTQKYFQDIQNQCIKYAHDMIESNEIPNKLKIFKKKNFFDDYKLQPSLPAYDYINFHLISIIYKKKISIYSIDYSTTNWSCEIYNNGYRDSIEIFNSDENKYESLFNISLINNAIFCQNIIFNLINNLFKNECHVNNDDNFKNLNKGAFINIDYEYYLKKKIKNKRKDSMLTKSYSEKFNLNNGFNLFGKLDNSDKLLSLIRERRKSSLDQSLMSIYEKEKIINYQEEEEIIIKRKQTKSVSPDLKNNLYKNFDNKEFAIKSNIFNLKDKKNNEINKNFKKKVNPNINEKELENISTDLNEKRFIGKLKFFDENKNYGFFILDIDGSDLFVHYDDLKKLNIPKEKINKYVYNYAFSFIIFKYNGKHNESRKAIEIQIENKY